jgi:signal transduction histidine kinase
LANLTADLLEYVASEPVTGASIDVNAAVASSCEIFTEKLAAEGIVLDLDLKPDIPAWGLNETLLRSVLINLIVNARDALAQKEGVRIITVSTGMDPQQGLSITVSDNGCGFDQQHAKDLFEPLYTTKGIEGSGMGLPLIQKYAGLSGGQLQVESQPGIGSKFSLIFPKAREESA